MSDFDYETEANIAFVDLRGYSLRNALIEIEKSPWMWLPKTNIDCLKAFIVGWLNANLNYEDEDLIKNFTQFVLEEYGEPKSSMDWYSMISSRLNSNSEEQFKLFYNLYFKFLENNRGHP